jgi:hypothetical protein
MSFEVTDHAAARYQDRIEAVTYPVAKQRLLDGIEQAKRTRKTASGGGEFWHYVGNPPFVAICSRDVFNRHDWVVKTVITEKQAFGEDELSVDEAVTSEIFEAVHAETVTISQISADRHLVNCAPKHLQPMIFPTFTRADLSQLLTVIQVERAKWKDEQKTLRALQSDRQQTDEYKTILRQILLMVRGNQTQLGRAIIACIEKSPHPGLLSVNFLGAEESPSLKHEEVSGDIRSALQTRLDAFSRIEGKRSKIIRGIASGYASIINWLDGKGDLL